MNAEELNKLMKECIEKYDLEGYEDYYGVIWFALCTQKVECNCIADHEKHGTYSFMTPHYDGGNEQEIYQVITSNALELDKILKNQH